MGSEWGISSAPDEQVLSRQCEGMRRAPRDRVQEYSVVQPEEGLDAALWNCVVEQIMIVC